MQEHLIQLHQALARMLVEQRRIEEQYTSNLAEVQKWQRRAKLAVDKKNDYLAREALIRKKYYTDMDAVLKRQLEQIPALIESHKRKLAVYEGKMLIDISAIGTASVFERVEAKILEIEALSQVVGELDGYGIIEKFAELETSGEIDKELKQLKDTINQPQELLIIKKAIQDTRNAFTTAVKYQNEIQNQYFQAEKDINTFHKQYLESFSKGDKIAATEALLNEATQKKLADTFETQIEKQEAIVNLLKENLEVLEQVKIMLENLTKLKKNEEKKKFLTFTSSDSIVDVELEDLRTRLNEM